MIRRPLLYVAAGYSAAIFISFYLGFWTCVIISTVLLAITILWKNDASYAKAVLLLTIAFAVGTGAFAYADREEDPLYRYAKDNAGSYIAITGTITKRQSITDTDGQKGQRLTIQVHKMGNRNAIGSRTLVNIYDSPTAVVPGDYVQVGGSIDLPRQRRNPKCFDYELYLRSIGIRTIVTATDISEAKDERNMLLQSYSRLVRHLNRFKLMFLQDLATKAGEETGALMNGILFGDKSEMDEQTVESFKKNGTAHILAVSGLHVGIIYAFLLKLWNAFSYITGIRRGWGFLAFVGSFFLCYMILASFSPSVVRAVIMVLLHAFAQITGRRYDLNSAAFAVFLATLIKNPYMLFNTGFEMSFLAVLSMCLVMPYVKRFYSGILMASLSVQLGLSPFIIYYFNYFSVLAVLINVPVVLLAGIIVPLGLCAWLLMPVLGDLASPLVWLLSYLCDVLRVLNDLTAVDGVITFTVASPDIKWIIGYYLALLLLASEEGRWRILKRAKAGISKEIAKSIVVIMLVTMAFGYMLDDGFAKANVTFVDVGQGDCMCIRTSRSPLRRDGVYLIDGGGSEHYNIGKTTLKPYLLKNGVSHVDGAFVTHLHTDHYKGICELSREGMIDHIYVYEADRFKVDQILEETGLAKDRIHFLYAGQRLLLGEQTDVLHREWETIQVLWPEQKTDAEYNRLLSDETDENALSLIFRVEFHAKVRGGEETSTSLLATGDLGEEGEREIIEKYRVRENLSGLLDVDVLKVGHHGSKTSSSDIFLNYVNPEIAVIQVGKNIYGHPTPEAMGRLCNAGARIYRNDQQGAIGLDIRNGTIHKIHTVIPRL